MNMPSHVVRVLDICDSAVNRDGLLTVVNGGLNRVFRTEYPAPLDASLAVSVEINGVQDSYRLDVAIQLIDESGAPVDSAPFSSGALIERDTSNDNEIDFDSLVLTFAVDARQLEIPRAGTYRFELTLNGEAVSAVRLSAETVAS